MHGWAVVPLPPATCSAEGLDGGWLYWMYSVGFLPNRFQAVVPGLPCCHRRKVRLVHLLFAAVWIVDVTLNPTPSQLLELVL